MSIIDRARDALDKANNGPWHTNSRQSRTFKEHVIVSPERGAYTICEMTDENAESAELVALSPELAAEVVRQHEQLGALADKLKTQGQRLGDSAYVHERAEGAGYMAAAAQLIEALEGEKE